MRKIHYLLFVFVAFLLSCNINSGSKKGANAKDINQNKSDFDFITEIKYAKGLVVNNYNDYKEIYIKEPKDSSVIAHYFLVRKGQKLPDSVKVDNSFVIPVPVKDIACMSESHVGALSILKLQDKLVGMGNLNYLWDSILRTKVKEDKLKSFGSGANVNIEKIIEVSPNMLTYGAFDKIKDIKALAKLNVFSIYNNEWKEETLLARAEWIKLFGLFFNKGKLADSIFNSIDSEFKAAIELAKKVNNKPKVIYGGAFKSTWYMPQSDTYVAYLLNNAGLDFKPAGRGNASTPLSMEEVINSYSDAPLWLCMVNGKIDKVSDLINFNKHYASFKAYKNNNVWINNKRKLPDGANDYWESGVYRPDLLIKDIVKIAHPDLLPDYETVYWYKLP